MRPTQLIQPLLKELPALLDKYLECYSKYYCRPSEVLVIYNGISCTEY